MFVVIMDSCNVSKLPLGGRVESQITPQRDAFSECVCVCVFTAEK